MKKVISMLLSLVMIISVFSLTQLNAFASQSTTVKFEQSEARTVLNMINSFRASSDAWYWNSDNATKTYVNSEPLQYDYTLEKIAMQRACELVYLYQHQRPNGSSVFDAYTQYGYSSTGKGENIASGYPEFTAEEVNNAWREDNEYYEGQAHRRAMLEPRFKAVGIAHVYYFDGKNNIHFWVEEFGTDVSNTTYTAPNDSWVTATLNDDKSVTVSNLTPNINSSAPFVTPNNNAVNVSNPKTPIVKSLKRGKKSFVLQWKKMKNISGYEIQISTNKKFKKAKKVKIKKIKTTKLTVKKLKKNKKYYVRMRAYRKYNGKNSYSPWTKTKSVKTK